MFKWLYREYIKYKRCNTAEVRMGELWETVRKGTKDKDVIREWAKLQGVVKDPYGDQERLLKRLNKRVEDGKNTSKRDSSKGQ